MKSSRCPAGEVPMRRRDCLFLKPFLNTDLHTLVEEPPKGDAEKLHAVLQEDVQGAFVQVRDGMCCWPNEGAYSFSLEIFTVQKYRNGIT